MQIEDRKIDETTIRIFDDYIDKNEKDIIIKELHTLASRVIYTENSQ